jgi:hypothetical protein
MGDDGRPIRGGAYRGAGGRRGQPQRALASAALAGLVFAVVPSQGRAQASDQPLQLRLAQGRSTEGLQLTVAPGIAVSSASQARLPIAIGPPGLLPKNSFIRVRGLPPMVSLSEGYVTAPGAWSVPIYALSSLQMVVPAGVTGRADLTISLVSEDGALLAQAQTVLTVQPPPEPPRSPPPREAAAEPSRPAAAVAPPPPRAPLLSPADREAAERFVARGEREAEQGNIAAARQFYLRAAQLGLARGALMLAATYDPRELARMGARGVQPNIAEARKWYERARELGAPEAEERLARLGGG